MSSAYSQEKPSILALSTRERFKGVNLRQNGLFVALLALVAFFAFTTPDAASLTPANFSNLVVQNGYILVLAIGMVIVIIAGHIDLSVGSVAAFIGAVAGILVVRPLEQDGWDWLPALCRGGLGSSGQFLVGALVGLARLLGCLRRDPGVHRGLGRHASLPRAWP
jgi:ABC-type xylose transport system permease subunit